MTDFHDYLNEQLQDPAFKKEYDALAKAFDAVQDGIDTAEEKETAQKTKRHATS